MARKTKKQIAAEVMAQAKVDRARYVADLIKAVEERAAARGMEVECRDILVGYWDGAIANLSKRIVES